MERRFVMTNGGGPIGSNLPRNSFIPTSGGNSTGGNIKYAPNSNYSQPISSIPTQQSNHGYYTMGASTSTTRIDHQHSNVSSFFQQNSRTLTTKISPQQQIHQQQQQQHMQQQQHHQQQIHQQQIQQQQLQHQQREQQQREQQIQQRELQQREQQRDQQREQQRDQQREQQQREQQREQQQQRDNQALYSNIPPNTLSYYGHPNQMMNGLHGHQIPLQFQPVVHQIQQHHLVVQQQQSVKMSPTSANNNNIALVNNNYYPSPTEGLPASLVESMRTLFDILDDSKQGKIRLSDIESRWEADNGGNGKNSGAEPLIKMGVMGYLRKVTPSDGMLTFDRFCDGLRLALINPNDPIGFQPPVINMQNNIYHHQQKTMMQTHQLNNVQINSQQTNAQINGHQPQQTNGPINMQQINAQMNTQQINAQINAHHQQHLTNGNSKLMQPTTMQNQSTMQRNSKIPSLSTSRLPTAAPSGIPTTSPSNRLQQTYSTSSILKSKKLSHQQIGNHSPPEQGTTLAVIHQPPLPPQVSNGKGLFEGFYGTMKSKGSLLTHRHGGKNGSLDNLKSDSEEKMIPKDRPPSAPLLDLDMSNEMNNDSYYPSAKSTIMNNHKSGHNNGGFLNGGNKSLNGSHLLNSHPQNNEEAVSGRSKSKLQNLLNSSTNLVSNLPTASNKRSSKKERGKSSPPEDRGKEDKGDKKVNFVSPRQRTLSMPQLHLSKLKPKSITIHLDEPDDPKPDKMKNKNNKNTLSAPTLVSSAIPTFNSQLKSPSKEDEKKEQPPPPPKPPRNPSSSNLENGVNGGSSNMNSSNSSNGSSGKPERSVLQSWKKAVPVEPIVISQPVLTATTNSSVAKAALIIPPINPTTNNLSNQTTNNTTNNVDSSVGGKEEESLNTQSSEVKLRNSKGNLKKREASRRHTVQSGIDFSTLKRLKQLEQERDVLQQGLSYLQKAQEWFNKQLESADEKIGLLSKGIQTSDHWSESHEESLNLLGCRISEVNTLLSALMDGSARLPSHMNLQIPTHLSMRTITRLKEQNRQLTQEVSEKSYRVTQLETENDERVHRVKQLETEKAMLLRQLFHQKNILHPDETVYM